MSEVVLIILLNSLMERYPVDQLVKASLQNDLDRSWVESVKQRRPDYVRAFRMSAYLNQACLYMALLVETALLVCEQQADGVFS